MDEGEKTSTEPTLPTFTSITHANFQPAPPTRTPPCLRFAAICVCLFLIYLPCERLWTTPTRDGVYVLPADSLHGHVNWKLCGEGLGGYECANITVPLNHHNASDERTIKIAVARYPAPDRDNRQGAIFLNPGGPGASGTNQVHRSAKLLSTIVQGQFDFIGFDPRGINLTSPYVSCFESEMEAEVFRSSVNGFSLNLPSNISAFSPAVHNDLARQIELHTAASSSLARKCRERTGEAIAYMGTESVVRDIDYLSRLIEGEDKPINWYGFSYGTIIGQYLIKVLPPHRIGRVIIDGVVNPTSWVDYPKFATKLGIEDIDEVLSSFASSCFAAGKNCSLNAFTSNSVFNFTRPAALLQAIDTTLDALYAKPVPVYDLAVPSVVTASNLRTLLFQAMYSMARWPDYAERLAEVFNGNFTGLLNATKVKINPEHAKRLDSSDFSVNVIFCSDTRPYDAKVGPPTSTELADIIFQSLEKHSPRMGDRLYYFSLCHAWGPAGLNSWTNRYNGTFEMEDDVLATPMLILSNTYDPVTPLASAKYANDRLSNNARLIQQRNGWGHCSLSQFSYCTARAIRAYMVHGTPPAEKHIMCDVDQLPWQPFDHEITSNELDDGGLKRAWRELTEDWARNSMFV